MIWTIVALLLIMWLIGVVTTNTFGGILHILLVIAVAVMAFRLITGRKVA